mmetsp:Transcript_20463/g.60531  ORF Transcript_20463/g.60531 Transcript_20463/m.60531 type:complete len:275 (+) Transcript_20463:2119-2943(+)
MAHHLCGQRVGATAGRASRLARALPRRTPLSAARARRGGLHAADAARPRRAGRAIRCVPPLRRLHLSPSHDCARAVARAVRDMEPLRAGSRVAVCRPALGDQHLGAAAAGADLWLLPPRPLRARARGHRHAAGEPAAQARGGGAVRPARPPQGLGRAELRDLCEQRGARHVRPGPTRRRSDRRRAREQGAARSAAEGVPVVAGGLARAAARDERFSDQLHQRVARADDAQGAEKAVLGAAHQPATRDEPALQGVDLPRGPGRLLPCAPLRRPRV